jgi:hypothetical protein
MRSHGYPFRRPSGLPPFGRRVDRIAPEGWGDGSDPPRWQRTPHDLDRPPLCSVAGGRNGHPTDRCSSCSSGTVGRPTSTRFDQMVPVSSRSRIRPTSTRPTPTWVRGRASKEPRRVGAGYRRPTGCTPRHGRARLSRHRTRIQGEVGMMRLRLAREWKSPSSARRRDDRRASEGPVRQRDATPRARPPTHVLLLISHRE